MASSRKGVPLIWLAGDPDNLVPRLAMGCAGVVTNTVVLRQLCEKYGTTENLARAYCDITDLPVVMEIEGETTEELMEAADAFLKLGPQIAIKIPMTGHGMRALRQLSDRGVETMTTTVFSATQAAAAAQAGTTHVLIFCEPMLGQGADPFQLISDVRELFSNWEDAPYVTAALVRTRSTAESALRAGAEGVIIFDTVFDEMLEHPSTTEWNTTFRDKWEEMRHDDQIEFLRTPARV